MVDRPVVECRNGKEHPRTSSLRPVTTLDSRPKVRDRSRRIMVMRRALRPTREYQTDSPSRSPSRSLTTRLLGGEGEEGQR
jgi:hypothetical protein